MNDTGVSAVVGTLLVLALVVGAITVYQLSVVPDQKERAEADHMDRVARDMAGVDADVLEQLRQVSEAPLSSPVRMSLETPAYVPDPSSTSALSFEADEHETTLGSPSMNIVSRDGEPLLSGTGTDGEWKTVQSGDTIENISKMLGLRIKITDADPQDNDTLKIQITDANGDYAGDLQVITKINQPDLDLIVQTQEPPSPGTVIFHNHILSIHQERWDSDYWIDALLDLYWFDLLIEDAEKPAALTFTDLGLDAEYKVSYEKQVSDDLSTTVGAGEVTEGYERTFGTGTLAYDAQNEFYPDQTLTVEHGALLRSQADGATFLVDPPFEASAGGGSVKVGLDVAALTGEADTVSGSGVATVRTRTTAHETFVGTAGELNLTWGTDHPDPWATFLEDELTDAGLTSQNCPPTSADSDCQFEVTTTSSSVRLDLHGPHALDADPSDPERDIVLDTQRGTIQTEVRS